MNIGFTRHFAPQKVNKKSKKKGVDWRRKRPRNISSTRDLKKGRILSSNKHRGKICARVRYYINLLLFKRGIKRDAPSKTSVILPSNSVVLSLICSAVLTHRHIYTGSLFIKSGGCLPVWFRSVFPSSVLVRKIK